MLKTTYIRNVLYKIFMVRKFAEAPLPTDDDYFLKKELVK